MTDPHLSAAAAAALDVDPHALGTYLDIDVSCSSIKITKAGDGLSKQLDIEPRVLMPRTTVYVLLEAEVGAHTHKPIPKSGTWELIQTLEAKTATFVEGDDMEKLIRMAADRVNAAAEARKGVQRLDGTNADDLEADYIVDAEIVDDELGELETQAGGRPEPEWDDDEN